MIAHATADGLRPLTAQPGARSRLPEILAVLEAAEDNDPIVIATQEGSEIDDYMKSQGYRAVDFEGADRAWTYLPSA